MLLCKRLLNKVTLALYSFNIDGSEVKIGFTEINDGYKSLYPNPYKIYRNSYLLITLFVIIIRFKLKISDGKYIFPKWFQRCHFEYDINKNGGFEIANIINEISIKL